MATDNADIRRTRTRGTPHSPWQHRYVVFANGDKRSVDEREWRSLSAGMNRRQE